MKTAFPMTLKIHSEIKKSTVYEIFVLSDFSTDSFVCFSKSINRMKIKLVGKCFLSVKKIKRFGNIVIQKI